MANTTNINSQPETVPATVNGTVAPPIKVKNSARRSREYLTEKEVLNLVKTAGENRQGHRDGLMVLLAYRHALRVSELIDLVWSDIDFDTARINVRRLKGSVSGSHPLLGDELRALRQHKRNSSGDEFVFMTERGAPFTAAGFRKLLTRLASKIPAIKELNVHPHMLRHSTGYALVNRGIDTRTLQGYLGHSNIQNTVIYTHLNANRFRNIWTK